MTALTTRRFTLDEFHRLGDLGFFQDDEGVELIRGQLVSMAPKRTPHSVCNTRLVKALTLRLGDRATVRGQEPVILPADSEPQPDVALVRNREDDYLERHPLPADILLLIEVSDSTLNYDQQTKQSLYAEDGVPYYWIFNLVESCLETYSEPYQDRQGCYHYRNKRVLLPTEQIALPGFPDIELDLAALFPPDVAFA